MRRYHGTETSWIYVRDEKRDYERMKSGVMEEVRRMFKPEFLNRIDEIMVFHSLNKENIRKIVTILLKNLEKRCQEQLDIILKVTGAAKDLSQMQALTVNTVQDRCVVRSRQRLRMRWQQKSLKVGSKPVMPYR